MSQSKLTNFFKSGKGPAEDNKPMKRQSLSLRKSVTPRVKREIEEEERIVISSDEENYENTKVNLSGTSVGSASSNCTVLYTPESPRKRLRDSFVYESPDLSVKVELPSPSKRETSTDRSEKVTSSPLTPYVTPSKPKRSISPVKATPSPSKKLKYFSPNKQRNVTLKTPSKGQRKMTNFVTSKKLFESDEDQRYASACDGVDDKTKFLLKIVNDFLKDNSLKKLLDKASVNLLDDYLAIPKPGSKLVCRLFWRKEGWYRREELKRIAAEDKNESIDEDTAETMLKALEKDERFLLKGTEKNMTIEELTSFLQADDLKDICKSLGLKRLKAQTKKCAVEALADFRKRTSIVTFFDPSRQVTNSERVRQKMIQKAGACYRLSGLARGALERLYRLTYLALGPEPLREKRLELMLINDKIQRETFPVDPLMCLDTAAVVFQSKDEFDRYLLAQDLYEKFLSTSDIKERCLIVSEVYKCYNGLSPEHLLRYESLPAWLQRFTPPHVHVKTLDEGLKDLKKGKEEANCLLAAEILDKLIGQSFRRHRRADWFAEKALVLHSYLGRPDQAAQVLIRGFQTEMSETDKDCMRPRARLIAQQKNIVLDSGARQTLLTFADKDSILESSIPSRHIFKQPKENITKGKAMYETKHDSGRVTQGVEEFACSWYILNEDFTHGCHWEGRIVTTIFFLLFWEIIYSPPKRGRGIFLSRLQRFPLDLFCEEFYANRKEAIDARLKFIEDSDVETLLGVMQAVWDGRPECELSGVCRDVGWAGVRSAARGLRPGGLAALSRRLAADYRRAHAGFPDLTLWDARTSRIMFVEVKSDSDKPSLKQIQWMQYLREHGIETEFCYVGAHTTRVKARRPVKPAAPSARED